jgi:hypothetical protein
MDNVHNCDNYSLEDDKNFSRNVYLELYSSCRRDLECVAWQYLERIISDYRPGISRLTAVDTRCIDQETFLYAKKLALTSSTIDGRSVGIVRLRNKGQGVFAFVK